MKVLFAIVVALILINTSCRSTRKLTQVIAIKDSTEKLAPPNTDDSARLVAELFSNIEKNHIDFNSFSAKMKVDYLDSKGRKYDFNSFVRIQKDSIMWVSIIAALGIEAFRVKITPDSIQILDKLNKTIEKKPISYLQEITQLPFDFKTLQNLIIGNPVYMGETVTSFKQSGEIITMSLAGQFFKHLMTFRKADFALLFSKLDDVDITKSRTANLAYEEYEMNGTARFANQRRISVAEKNHMDVNLEFKQVEFNKPLSFPFSIPRNYKMK